MLLVITEIHCWQQSWALLHFHNDFFILKVFPNPSINGKIPAEFTEMRLSPKEGWLPGHFQSWAHHQRKYIFEKDTWITIFYGGFFCAQLWVKGFQEQSFFKLKFDMRYYQCHGHYAEIQTEVSVLGLPKGLLEKSRVSEHLTSFPAVSLHESFNNLFSKTYWDLWCEWCIQKDFIYWIYHELFHGPWIQMLGYVLGRQYFCTIKSQKYPKAYYCMSYGKKYPVDSCITVGNSYCYSLFSDLQHCC